MSKTNAPANSCGLKVLDCTLGIVLICVGIFVAGFVVGIFAVFTKNAVDNTALPLVVLFIISLIFIGRGRSSHEDSDCIAGTDRSEKGGSDKPSKLGWPLPLRFSSWVTAIVLVFLCFGLITGTFVAKGYWHLTDERPLSNNLTGTIEPKNPESFSFIAFGDTRSEVVLPSLAEADSAEIKEALKKRHTEARREDIDLRFHPDSLNVRMRPDHEKPDSLLFRYDTIWPTVGYRKGPEHPGKFYDGRAFKRVFKEVARRVNPKKAGEDRQYVDLAVHTGDIVLWGGNHGSPYWAAFDSLFYRKLKRSCFSKRLLPAIGNHEYWYDDKAPLSSFFKTFPHLKPPDSPDGYHYYALKYGNSFFIFLCTGKYVPGEDKKAGVPWECLQADCAAQAAWLDEALAYAKDCGVSHIFVTYHKPTFTWSKHKPLDSLNDPFHNLVKFKRDHPTISMTVFSGHNHTTEVFSPDDINYLVLGGGGASQYFGEDTQRAPDPEELYWKEDRARGKKRKELYNFLKVDINGGNAKLRLFTWDPTDTLDHFVEGKLPREIRIAGASPSPEAHGIVSARPLKDTVKLALILSFVITGILGSVKGLLYYCMCQRKHP
jgi:hypothetical protein